MPINIDEPSHDHHLDGSHARAMGLAAVVTRPAAPHRSVSLDHALNPSGHAVHDRNVGCFFAVTIGPRAGDDELLSSSAVVSDSTIASALAIDHAL